MSHGNQIIFFYLSPISKKASIILLPGLVGNKTMTAFELQTWGGLNHRTTSLLVELNLVIKKTVYLLLIYCNTPL